MEPMERKNMMAELMQKLDKKIAARDQAFATAKASAEQALAAKTVELQAAADAAEAGFRTRVLLDYTAGVSAESTTNAIAALKDSGVTVV